RGEIAATETYQQAIAKLGAAPQVAELRNMHAEHRAAANTLRQHVHAHAAKPDQGSGTWGGWAKLVEGTAALVGQANALRALKEGEEHGVKDYETALKDKTMGPECVALIRELLPKTRMHVAALDRMISSIA
ncbi:MAG TPA: DUF2383 domain-containing protein, partial [Gemmataceae bacterium]|nr:DUF2383 domain-containing protein [Gemmataceae bacterium]